MDDQWRLNPNHSEIQTPLSKRLSQSNCSQCYLLQCKSIHKDRLHSSSCSKRSVNQYHHSIDSEPYDGSPKQKSEELPKNRPVALQKIALRKRLPSIIDWEQSVTAFPLITHHMESEPITEKENIPNEASCGVFDAFNSLNRSSFLNNAETDSSAKSRWIVEKRSESLTKMLSTKRSLIYFSFLLECFAIAFWFNKTQPNEFIDEQFHWNQTKAYCGGNFFEWNEKITTPPGLYLISYVFSKLISLLGFDADRCESLNLLRSINIIFSIGNLILFRNYFHYFFKITSSIKFSSPASSKNIDLQSLLSSLSVVHLPPLFFFTFLFYTDIGSIFFIILTYYMAIVRERHWIATFSGFISLLFRQTNIVWLFFIAASSSIDISILHYVQHSEYGKNHFRILNKSIYFPPFECRFSNPKYFICFITDLIISICWANIGYLANAFIFLIFLFINKGIVLGDRNAHQSVLHLAQIPYYLTFSFIFAWPLILNYSNLIKVFNQIISRPTLIIVCTIFLVICLCPVFKYEHPYLLADNRHYVFYLWRKFWFRKDYAWFRYLPLPFYLLTLISIWNLAHFPSINEFKRPLKFLRFDAENFKKILFFISLIITIVPQSLIEFRYFLTPFVIWRLNVRLAAEVNHKNSLQVIELVWFLILNLLTFFIFHFKTFQHLDGSIQRIIW